MPAQHAIDLIAPIVSVNEYTAVWTRVGVLELPVDGIRIKVTLAFSFHKNARGLCSQLMFVSFTSGALVPQGPRSILHSNKRPHVAETVL